VTGAFAASAFGGDRTVASSPVLSPVADSGAGTVASVAQAVQPSVVSIQAGNGGGSGVVLSADGLILTNNHVAALASGGAEITVRFNDGRTAKATVKGTDPATDLAVLQASGVSGLTAASLGDSDRLKVGDSVLAIGSPLGLAGSVTAGIVSALNRTVNVGGEEPPGQQFPPGWGRERRQEQPSEPTTIGGAIQTDAAINHGNSGGALVNASGQVVGINTAIATAGSEGNIGVGFAIPINTAKKVADQLIKNGDVRHAQLGVTVQDSTGGTAGALVGSVAEGSAAAKAGLRQGDLITKIDDRPIDASDTLVGMIRGFGPGQQITITYVRDGQTHTAKVTLAEKTE
ncbi:trypsin, partial [Spongiactinospora gelatinilytica]